LREGEQKAGQNSLIKQHKKRALRKEGRGGRGKIFPVFPNKEKPGPINVEKEKSPTPLKKSSETVQKGGGQNKWQSHSLTFRSNGTGGREEDLRMNLSTKHKKRMG